MALQAVLAALLAMAALVCAGLGGTVAVVSQTLAGKLAASVPFVQRHGGTSQATRALRRELPAIAAEQKVAEALLAGSDVHGDGVLPASPPTPPIVEIRTDARASAALAPDLAPRRLTPPSRAPPLTA